MKDRITAAQAARRLGITVRTLYRWADAGKIRDAPRMGNYRMFYVADVDALLFEKRGVRPIEKMDLNDVYMRLTAAETWEDIADLRRDMEAAICSNAEDKSPLEAAYKAATSMAATHPDEDARDRWARTAKDYGVWLEYTGEETELEIKYKGRKGSYVTYESAKRELEAAPTNPAYDIAMAERTTR